MMKSAKILTSVWLFLWAILAFGTHTPERGDGITNRHQVLTPVKRSEVTSEPSLRRERPIHHGVKWWSQNNLVRSPEESTLWALQYTDGVAEYYLGSGAAGDTFVVVFTPSAPCSVKYVETSWENSGGYAAFVAKYSDEAQMEYPDGRLTEAQDDIILPRPIGDIIVSSAAGTVTNPGVNFGDTLPEAIGEFQIGNESTMTAEPFVIGLIKNAELPQPMADGSRAPVTHTWFCGPWTDSNWESYHSSVEINMRALVTYPWGAPIAFTIEQLPNTYALSGPMSVRFHLVDDVEEGTAISNEDDIVLYASTGSDTVEIGYTDFTEDDVEENGNGWYTADITGLTRAEGNEVSYWIEATDNQGLHNVSEVRSFLVKQPANPDADVLVIMDNGAARSSVYLDVLDEIGVEYETWNPDIGAEFGIDSSVINYGWKNIIVFGFGAETLPAIAENTDPGYAAFLDNGGSLFYADQDYFFSHSLPETGMFEPGDFAFDYLGLSEFTNDPTDPEGNPIADSVFTGLAGVVSDIPTYSIDGGLEVWGLPSGYNFGDYISAAEGAIEIFEGQYDGECYGVQNTTTAGGTTVYLSFMAEANVTTTVGGTIVPGDQFTALITHVMTKFIESQVQYGDVDGNGAIQAFDASLILKHTAGMILLTMADSIAADVTSDHSISAFDAAVLLQYGVGVIDSLPYDTTEAQLLASGEVVLSDQGVIPGAAVAVPISLHETNNLLGVEGTFEYNPEHLEFRGIQWTDMADGALRQVQQDNGQVQFALARSEARNASGVLAYLQFILRDEFNADYSLVTLNKLRLNENVVQTNVATATLFRTTDISKDTTIPETYILQQNHPNPFNPTTTIRFGLPGASQVTITVYDLLGRKIITLFDGQAEAGWHTVEWHGRNQSGHAVSSGVYFYRIETPAYQSLRKMIYMK